MAASGGWRGPARASYTTLPQPGDGAHLSPGSKLSASGAGVKRMGRTLRYGISTLAAALVHPTRAPADDESRPSRLERPMVLGGSTGLMWEEFLDPPVLLLFSVVVVALGIARWHWSHMNGRFFTVVEGQLFRSGAMRPRSPAAEGAPPRHPRRRSICARRGPRWIASATPWPRSASSTSTCPRSRCRAPRPSTRCWRCSTSPRTAPPSCTATTASGAPRSSKRSAAWSTSAGRTIARYPCCVGAPGSWASARVRRSRRFVQGYVPRRERLSIAEPS